MIRNFVRQSRPWIQNLEGSMKNSSSKINHEGIIKKENVNKVIKPREQNLEEIVKEYNERWKQDITVEEYLKNFTRKHRGAC